MSFNKYINLGLGALVVCICLQGALLCGDEALSTYTSNRFGVRIIQIEPEVSEVVDAA
jgi:hypothetical protein